MREGVAGGVRRNPGGAGAPTPIGFRGGGFAGRARRARGFGAERRRGLARRLGFAFKVAEAILFRQAPRRGARRFGRGDETVPAPEVAFERDQPLAGLEFLRKPLAIGARDHSDLSQAAGERRRRGDARAKRIGAGRQQRILLGRRDQRPVRRRRLIDRGVEIVAQRRAKRGLIAARDADRVDRARPGPARVGAEKARDRARLRLQPLRCAFGLSQGRAMARFAGASFGVALLRSLRFTLGGGERLGQLGDGLSARRALCLLKPRCAERAALALDSGIFGLKPREAPPLLCRPHR